MGKEVVALLRPRGVLGHHLLEERSDVVLARVAGIADILAIVMSSLG